MKRMMITASLVVLTSTAFAPFPATPSDPETVPMLMQGTRPAVHVRVNGQGPFLFMIDTGAGGPPARADTSLVDTLALQIAGQAETSDGAGTAATVRTVRFDQIQLGSRVVRDVEAYTRSYNGTSFLPRIAGILGPGFFHDVLLTLDYPQRQVRTAHGALPLPDGRNVFSYRIVEGNMIIRLWVGTRTVDATLDSGNVRSIDAGSGWVAGTTLRSFPRQVGGSSSVSGTAVVREVRLAETIRIGCYTLTAPLVTFADEFEELNIGSALLQGFAITIDQRSQRVRLTCSQRGLRILRDAGVAGRVTAAL